MDKTAYEAGHFIARAIGGVDTDHRGDALMQAAEVLKKNAQGFTAAVLERAAKDYGTNQST